MSLHFLGVSRKWVHNKCCSCMSALERVERGWCSGNVCLILFLSLRLSVSSFLLGRCSKFQSWTKSNCILSPQGDWVLDLPPAPRKIQSQTSGSFRRNRRIWKKRLQSVALPGFCRPRDKLIPRERRRTNKHLNTKTCTSSRCAAACWGSCHSFMYFLCTLWYSMMNERALLQAFIV